MLLSCIGYYYINMYLRYIPDSFSEFNVYQVVKGVFVYFRLIVHPVDLWPNSEAHEHFQT